VALFKADLNTNGLITITESLPPPKSIAGHKYILTSSAFTGLRNVTITNTLPAGKLTASLQGDKLTVDVLSYQSTTATPYEFSIKMVSCVAIRCRTVTAKLCCFASESPCGTKFYTVCEYMSRDTHMTYMCVSF
jgi:hypothetical protein